MSSATGDGQGGDRRAGLSGEPRVVHAWQVDYGEVDLLFDLTGEFGPDVAKLGKLAVRFDEGQVVTLNVEPKDADRLSRFVGLTRTQLAHAGLLKKK